MNGKLAKAFVTKVSRVVTGYGGGGAISGWSGGSKKPYTSLRGRMGRRSKKGFNASPRPVRVDPGDIVKTPTTLDDTAMTEVKQHFEKPPERLE